ncbi:unnamed protein product, partial [Oppiella nova]
YHLIQCLDETKRERDFYRRRGLPYPKANDKDKVCDKDVYTFPTNAVTKEDNSDCHRSDEQVNILLETNPTNHMKSMKRKFIRCSAQATVTHLKKFVAKKLFNNLDRYKEVEILCNEEILGKDHTLKFVCVTRWRFKV